MTIIPAAAPQVAPNGELYHVIEAERVAQGGDIRVIGWGIAADVVTLVYETDAVITPSHTESDFGLREFVRHTRRVACYRTDGERISGSVVSTADEVPE